MSTDNTDDSRNSRTATGPGSATAEGTVATSPVLPRPVSGTEGEPAPQEGRSAPLPLPSAREPVALPSTGPARRRRVAAPALVAADLAGTVAAVLACAGPQAAPVLLVPVCASLPVLCTRRGLYRPGLDPQALDELPAVGKRAAVAWCVGATVLAACDRTGALGAAGLLAGVAANTALVCALRALVHGVRRRRGRRRPRSALVVGRGETARTVSAALAERPRYGLRPTALVEVGPDDDAPLGGPDGGLPDAGRTEAADGNAAHPPLPVVSTPEELAREVARNAVRDAVFLRSPWEDPHSAALARLLGARGVDGWLVRPGCALGAHGGHALSCHRRPDEAHLWGFSCRRLTLECPRPRTGLRKRLLDIALVAPALLLAAPVMAGCALAVRVLDGPGVLFRQERIGQDGRPFTLLKFRSVRPTDDHEAATCWSVAGDTRTSPVGRLLRRTSLDELPQLWNVLRGDMSLVGPRPERPYFVGHFSRLHPGYAQRHRAPVGITGLAQVHGLRGDTSIADRARFDNHYIETWSLWQDVRIICRTAASLFRLEGR
ncbi:exopolysaccharide biosynthesis polyprenyl glycosylphosphotransferase [Streptomyces sp. NPDC006784]|uniref:exopolysaccharide biosynthesis polyprenyl glycosylphosphotransferase n=1 Tax=Streptomyces sp. NPDC006784 TaxID=3364764 RepID=UPI00369E144D